MVGCHVDNLGLVGKDRVITTFLNNDDANSDDIFDSGTLITRLIDNVNGAWD